MPRGFLDWGEDSDPSTWIINQSTLAPKGKACSEWKNALELALNDEVVLRVGVVPDYRWHEDARIVS
jgi:hypothetical protein